MSTMLEISPDDFSHLSLAELIVARDKAKIAHEEAKEAYEDDLDKWGSASHFIIVSKSAHKTCENTYSRLIRAVEKREK